MLRLTPLIGEIVKIHKNSFISNLVIFSLLIWPIMAYFNVYYTYYSFEISILADYGIDNHLALMTFIITGFLGFYSFWCMVQSAWQMGYERKSGTLEMIMLSPANRLLVLYGRALGALVEHIWMFAVFSTIIIFYSMDISVTTLANLLLIFVVLVISSTVWGGFMNAVFMFSRDVTFLYYVFNYPMELFSGVKIPIASFPVWGRILSMFYPLTYCLIFIREIIFKQEINWTTIYALVAVLVVTVILTLIIVKRAEINSRKNGTFTFY